MGTWGCSYAVRVNAESLNAAMEQLRAEGLLPMRVFRAETDGTFSEMTI